MDELLLSVAVPDIPLECLDDYGPVVELLVAQFVNEELAPIAMLHPLVDFDFQFTSPTFGEALLVAPGRQPGHVRVRHALGSKQVRPNLAGFRHDIAEVQVATGRTPFEVPTRTSLLVHTNNSNAQGGYVGLEAFDSCTERSPSRSQGGRRSGAVVTMSSPTQFRKPQNLPQHRITLARRLLASARPYETSGTLP